MREERVKIPNGDIQLEGLLYMPETLSTKGGVIFCHPHPQYGGDMDNPVITTGVEVASQEGFSTLRFNFRGVGESEGSYGEGVGEKEDVQAVIEYFHLRHRMNPPFFILFGYSFGAWVGLPIAVQDVRIHGMVAVAPPLTPYNFDDLVGCKKKKLIIAGDKDQLCPAPILKEWFQTLEEPKSFKIISGADHFFSFHTHLLAQPLREFFKTI